MDEKISTFEINLLKVEKDLVEKDSYIVKLEEKVTKLEKLCEHIENRH